jgi:hypothetical protein
MKQGFELIERGMSMEQVETIMGPPDEVHPTGFGDKKMTTWTYHAEEGLVFVWFDEDDHVKLKSRK